MRVLVVFGSKRGGTEGLARMLAQALVERGHEVVVEDAGRARGADGFDAVLVGGALYANCWHARSRRFVERNLATLRKLPVWFFSSGPLDESAEKKTIAPTNQVAILMERAGAQGHATFGGRLEPTARGFPASAMARKHAGDWRDAHHVSSWASEIANSLPDARPLPATDPPARSLWRLLGYGALGWALCSAVMALLLALTSKSLALTVHAIAAPIVFAIVAHRYFAARGARGPLATATVFVLAAIVLDLAIVAGATLHSLAMFTSFVGTWLPLGLAFLVTWTIGELMSLTPWPKPEARGAPAARQAEAH